MGYENEIGALSPVGFFDPLGLSSDIDAATFRKYRESELKHGRVAQLAVLGYVVPEIFRFPGEIAPGLKFADIPNGIAAIQAVPALGWIQIFFLIGFIDNRVFAQDPKKPAGEFGFGDYTGDATELQTKEIQNGRLALLAILELLRHDAENFITKGSDVLVTGLPFLYGQQ